MHNGLLLFCMFYRPTCALRFTVENAAEDTIFTIDGPMFPVQCICCPRDLEFSVSEVLCCFLASVICVGIGHATVENSKCSCCYKCRSMNLSSSVRW